MSFRMPASVSPGSLPLPKNEFIRIEEFDHDLCAVLSFGGFSTNRNIRKKIELFKSILIKKGLSFDGEFEFLSYNEPYKALGRRHEILVHLSKESKEQFFQRVK